MILQLTNSQGGNRTWLFIITVGVNLSADTVDALPRVGAITRCRTVGGRFIGGHAEVLKAVTELDVEAEAIGVALTCRPAHTVHAGVSCLTV